MFKKKKEDETNIQLENIYPNNENTQLENMYYNNHYNYPYYHYQYPEMEYEKKSKKNEYNVETYKKLQSLYKVYSYRGYTDTDWIEYNEEIDKNL
jgi:hypothetical protein